MESTTDVDRGSGGTTCWPALPLDSIVCGDNCDVLGTFPRECIDLVVTSPPYDDLRTYGGHSWDFEGVAQQLWRVIKPGGVVVWVVADATVNGSETGTSFRQALRFMEIGFRLHDTMIYQQTRPPLTHNRYEQEFEYVFVLSRGKPKAFVPLMQAHSHWTIERRKRPHTTTLLKTVEGHEDKRTLVGLNPDGRIRGNVWFYPAGPKASQDPVAFNHPAIFPEALARDHILSWSNEGDIVLDPFNGSGTTTKMARAMGRRFIGIDVNESYCEIARKRLAQKLLEFDAAS